MEKLATLSKAEREEYIEKNDVRDNVPVSDVPKYIEMQMNKKNNILDKAKLVVIKLDKVFVIIPYTYSKIELRMRNVIINHRQILDGISHFMNFYLINFEFQKHIMN
jgi:hypothetical protein